MLNHKKRPKGAIIAAIDVGSAKTACLVAQVIDDKGTAEIIGIGHVASNGVKASVIVDLKETADTVRRAVHAAENMAAKIMKGYPLRDVVMNVSSVYTRSQRASAHVQIMGHTIAEPDIQTALLRLEEDHDNQLTIIHSIPTEFNIDGHAGVENPLGMHAQSLLVDVHCVMAETAALKNVITCAESNHLDVDCLCVAPYAAGLSALVPDEIDMGCLVIDMGAGVTSYAVFYHGAMIYTGAVPVGGWHVTNDLATGLNTSFSAAERIKTLYGSVSATSSDSGELIDVPMLGEDSLIEEHQVPRSTLVSIIRPRLEETFELIRGDIDFNGMDPFTGGRVILTGGASQLSGVRELAHIMLNKQVRLGRPVNCHGLAEATCGPEFAATVGLLNYACERLDEQPRTTQRHNSNASIWLRVKKWFHENW